MVDEATLREAITRHEAMDTALRTDPVVRDVHRLYTSINEKSAALIGHVSLMIAACTFLAARAEGTAKTFYLGETVGYLVLAIFLLPVLYLSMFDAPMHSPEILRSYFARSSILRANMHKGAVVFTFILTLAVLVTIIGEGIFAK